MAVRFDSAPDRLSHQGAYPTPATAVTVTMWVRVEVDRNDFQTFARLHDGATLITFALQGDGTSGPGHFTGGGDASFADDLDAVGKWVPIATTRAGTAAKSYRRVGGGVTTTVASGTITGVTGTPSGICIGGRGGEASASNDATEWLNGSVAYVRVWAAELTQAEIEAEWASPTPVRATNLHSNWPLATATDLTDTVGGKTLVTQTGGTPATATGPALIDSRPNGSRATAGASSSSATAKRVLGTGRVVAGVVAASTPRKRVLGTGRVVAGGGPLAQARKRTLATAVAVAGASSVATARKRAGVTAQAISAALPAGGAGKRWATTGQVFAAAVALAVVSRGLAPPGPLRPGVPTSRVGRLQAGRAVNRVTRLRPE